MSASFEDTQRWLQNEEIAGDDALRSVAYVRPKSLEGDLLQVPPWEAAPMGVELGFESGRCLAITWHMAGKCHGLVVGGVSVEALRDSRVALSKCEPQSHYWRRRIGGELRSIKARWHVSDGGCPPTVWALEFSFNSLATLIALGELGPGGPIYMPDELVVGFGDEGLATFKNAGEIHPH